MVPGWADPAALAEAPRGRHRVTLLSPFDSLLWDRKRTRRMFGFEHSLEAYVPRAKRVHGYYTMPLLAGGRLLGRVDPVRQGQTLVARQLSLDSAAAVTPMARALREAAEWVGLLGGRGRAGQPPGPRVPPALRPVVTRTRLSPPHSSGWCAMAAGSRPASSQPATAAASGMPTRMSSRLVVGTLVSSERPSSLLSQE